MIGERIERTIKRILFAVLLSLPVFLSISLSYLDRRHIVPPLKYRKELVVRNDLWGKGTFGASRSGGRRHKGVDLLASMGEAVYAVRSGVVLNSEFQRGLGNYVEIRHADGWVSIYGHLNKRYVKKGQWIQQGQLIGEVGKSGNANHRLISPHLHFELHNAEGIALDPMLYLNEPMATPGVAIGE